ncbi:PHD finger protein ING1 [Glycine soja]
MSFLEEFQANLDSLPVILQKKYALLRDLDKSLHDIQRQNEQRCEQEIEDIRRGVRSGNITPDTSVIRFSDEALDEQNHSIRVADEKVALAVQAYDLVDTHIQHLDQYLKRFERENAAITGVPASGSEGNTKSGRGNESGTGRGGRKKTRQTTVTPAATEAQATANPTGMDLELPVDPNEPTYCFCNQVSYGAMVACDNPNGVATCTQHYCWGTQQTVKWRNCPSVNLIPEEAFSGNFSEDPFSETFRKNLPEDEFLIFGSFQKLLPEGPHPECFRKKLLPEDMNEDQWRYDFAMSQEVHMDYDYDNQEECGVNEPHVDCSNAFNTSQVFATRDDVLQWARTVAHENGFVAVIMRSDTETGSRGRSSFVLIGCERSSTYKCRNKEFVRKDTGSRKCCPFRLRGKPVHGGEGWMVKLICGIHNHELVKSLVGHPYAGRLTKEEKKIIADMTKSMVKPKNILLTLKEHNADSCTTIKQIYNARSAYHSSIRGADTEITYKTNRYRLPLHDFVGVTPTAMTFSAEFAYLEAKRALERFRGLFLRNDRLPLVIVTDRDLALMNAVKTVFPESTNLLCRFHIDKNVKAKYKSLIGEKNAWDYVMDNWGTLVDCPSEHEFHESHQKFQVACSPWPMFIDYVNDTWIIPHKEKFITAWTNKVMHLGNTTTNRVESAHWALKRVLQNSVGYLCSVWDAMNNMITLQHVEIKASFEISTHVVGHVYKKTLYKRLLGMVSRDALNQIASEVDRLRYLGNNLSSCGCVMRSTHGLPCACELSRYIAGKLPLESVHLFWRRLCFSDQGLCETEVTIKEEIEIISKRFDELDVAGKVTLKSKLQEIAYPDHNSMCPPPSKVNTKGAPKKPMKRSQRSTKRDPSYWEYVDAFHSVQSSNSPVKRSFIRDVVDVKADGNCGYRSIAALLGMGENSWPLVSVDKWMDITDMGYVIASLYNVILVSLSRQQSMTFFPLRSQSPRDSSGHCIICVGHVFGNHFVQVYLKDHCPLPPPALLWSSNCYSQAKQWTIPYISRMQQYTSLMSFKTHYLSDKQFLDEIHYRKPFTDTGNQIRFECMKLINDDDVNTMLMSNDQFSCVGPIELLCTVGRTPDGIINLLERTMPRTHDAILYYNGKWNMPPQNKFVGCAFTGKNPKKFQIPSTCTIDELKNLIKQVAPKGIPPLGIHESQTVRRLFFRQPARFEYSDMVIKYEINELITNE